MIGFLNLRRCGRTTYRKHDQPFKDSEHIMRFTSIGSRIVTSFLCMLMVVQVAAFLVIRAGIDANAVTATSEHLDNGDKVLALLLEQNAQRLLQSARTLAGTDLQRAVETGDSVAIDALLKQAASRVGASYAIYIDDRQHQVLAGTGLTKAERDDVTAVIKRNEKNAQSSGTVLLNGHPYQVAIKAIPTSMPGRWVSLGYKIDARFMQILRRVSSLELVVLGVGRDGTWKHVLTTLPAADTALLESGQRGTHSATQSGAFAVKLSHDDYNARSTPLAQNADRKVLIVLLRSITDATTPYQTLQMTLLALTALGILLVGLGSIWAVRKITRPLQQLCETAQALGTGDYTERSVMDRPDEIGDLSRTLESMREGIATRQSEVTRLAFWDTVTGLPNRAQFARLLEAEIASAADGYRPFCLLMLDLDRFKHVNDALGHAFGDALLRHVGERLLSTTANLQATVARLGGDEFAILLQRSAIDDARALAATILKVLEVPIVIDEQPVDLGAGIGIAAFPAHGLTARALMSHAEMAMYAAKQTGNDAVVYDVTLGAGSEQNLTLLSELRRAVEQKEFRLFIQPKLAMGTRKVIGGEALIRWQKADGSMVRPDQFIPFAEKSGFIRVLTQWMFEQSCILASQMHEQGLHFKISVNLSARDLLDRELPTRFQRILHAHGVEASTFCLEITESTIMEDPARSLLTLDLLHKMGLELSIDDFGTGYSSLAYLKKLPVDELKIDQSFVMNMAQDQSDEMIVRSTIDLGHNMGLRVVAEGIESRIVWDLLAKMGCDHAQGYFMSRPMPGEQFLEWAQSNQSMSMLADPELAA
jgi:diguanylate cyclase (GGDEF)-like protein